MIDDENAGFDAGQVWVKFCGNTVSNLRYEANTILLPENSQNEDCGQEIRKLEFGRLSMKKLEYSPKSWAVLLATKAKFVHTVIFPIAKYR